MGVLAIVLGILAIVCALIATFLLGTTGVIIAAVLAVAAVALAFLKRKNDGKGGIAAIVIAVLEVILALSLSSVWSRTFTELHKKALEVKPDGLWAQVSEKTDGGLMGLISDMPKDEAFMNKLVEEINELNKALETK